MGLWAGMKWVVREGTGAGVQRRLTQVILGNGGAGARAAGGPAHQARGIRAQFLEAATTLVAAHGPSWAQRKLGGRAFGVWLLVILWVLPPSLLALAALRSALVRAQARVPRPVAGPVRSRGGEGTLSRPGPSLPGSTRGR